MQADAPGRIVEYETADAHALAGRPSVTSQQHPASCFELAEVEWLAQTVIRTDIKRTHTVLDIVVRTQHQHRRDIAAPAHALQQAHAIQSGQHDAEYHEIKSLVPQNRSGGDSVVLPVDRVPTATQAARDRTRETRIVFDQQDAHDVCCVCFGTWSARRIAVVLSMRPPAMTGG